MQTVPEGTENHEDGVRLNEQQESELFPILYITAPAANNTNHSLLVLF